MSVSVAHGTQAGRGHFNVGGAHRQQEENVRLFRGGGRRERRRRGRSGHEEQRHQRKVQLLRGCCPWPVADPKLTHVVPVDLVPRTRSFNAKPDWRYARVAAHAPASAPAHCDDVARVPNGGWRGDQCGPAYRRSLRARHLPLELMPPRLSPFPFFLLSRLNWRIR
jgi:hypothetical protein